MTSPDLKSADPPRNLFPRIAREISDLETDVDAPEISEVSPPRQLQTPLVTPPETATGPDPRRRFLSKTLPQTIKIVLEAVLLAIALSLVPFDGNRAVLIIAVVVLVTIGQSHRQRLSLSVMDDLPRLTIVVLTATITSVFLVDRSSSVAKTALIAAVALVGVVIGRNIAYIIDRRMRRSERFQRRTIVIGGGMVASQIVASMVKYPEHGLHAQALLDDSPMPAAFTHSVPVGPLADHLRTHIAENNIDTVVIAFSSLRESAMLSLLRECDRMDCEVFVVPRLFEYISITGDMDRLHSIPLMRIRRDVHRSIAWRFKRVTSAVIASAMLAVLSPVLAVTAIAVYFSDRSAPILFRQTRVSTDNNEFTCLKFRSMRPESSTESETKWNISQDSRVGRVGKFIRKTSLDELPQLWNVLRGDMALVGPRPERPHFVEKFNSEIPSYSARHRVPGGLTGWAAVNGLRGDTSLADRALYDNYYIENWSLWLDAKILVRTLLAVLKRTGS